MKIAIDVDNVLCNTTEVLLRFYNAAANDTLTMNDITDYQIDGFVKPEWRNRVWEFFADRQLWKQIECLPDSQRVVQQLSDDGHDLYIVTATHGADLFGKWRWIKRNYPSIKTDNIIRCVHKQLLKLDVLIDDYQDNLKGGKYHGILVDYKWNENYPAEYRAKNWKEIYDCINRIGGIA